MRVVVRYASKSHMHSHCEAQNYLCNICLRKTHKTEEKCKQNFGRKSFRERISWGRLGTLVCIGGWQWNLPQRVGGAGWIQSSTWRPDESSDSVRPVEIPPIAQLSGSQKELNSPELEAWQFISNTASFSLFIRGLTFYVKMIWLACTSTHLCFAILLHLQSVQIHSENCIKLYTMTWRWVLSSALL